jgi:branched-chain amino acid transport system ATP-binding protein
LLLTVSNLEVCYGVISALQDVSVEIGAEEIVTLIGANGAGKTTLLRTISGLIKPARGTIAWQSDARPHLDRAGPASHKLEYERGAATAGTRLERLQPHEIVRLGVSHVPEGRQVFPHLSVRENLLLGAYQQTSKELIRADLERCYEQFPVLAERKEQRAGTLSGGEQQMLAIGRALMARPKLLLLDEPSLGLAPLVVRKIFEIIREINAAGTTIFLIEQNAHMALNVAHRAYVLQSGRVIRTDKASALLEDPDVKKAYLGG